MNFVHLKTYSEFSITQGINRLPELIGKAVKNNMPAIAITETNGLFSAISFYKEAREKGVKPIIGIDVTVEQDDSNTYQLTLLAKNESGYRALVQANSRAYLENRKSTGCALKEEWLADLHDVIVLSGAKQGLIGQKILSDNLDEAKEVAQQMRDVFGADFYIELQRDGSPSEDKYMDGAVAISQELNIAPVATHPAFFLEREHFVAHEARFCISNKYSLFDMSRPKPFNKDMYFKTPQEMEELFADLPQALENTVQIAKKCNIELLLDKPNLPSFPTPNGEDEGQYFLKIGQEGLEKRLKKLFKTEDEINKNRKPYDDRFALEVGVIQKMGFPGYFLIVSDFISWAKENDIPIGPGRGSGAGSLVAYAMGITDVNPLPYGLLFERFLNPERVSMPDFDIDMCQDRRIEIIDYVKKKYGEQSVCQIGTFTTMAAKAVIRDVGRTLNYPYDFVDSLAKMVLIAPNKPMTLKQFIFGGETKQGEEIPPDEKMLTRYENERDVKKLIDIALTIEGLTKNIGTHASGVLISPTVLTDFTPLYTLDVNTKPVSQLDMTDVEKAGLVKFDFLGLKNLTIIQNTVNLINERVEDKVDLQMLPLEDSAIFENIFANGNTTSVFQFESKGMKSILQKAKPNQFEDIAALNALFRPGPMKIIPDFISAKNKKEDERQYPHPLLKNLLTETYGFMIYQEQVMECAKIIAGFTLGSADMLRRAMGKKKPEEMKKQRELFVKGAADHNNISSEKANELFDTMEEFAGYGFNKSHAVAYALVAYQTAYLKYYHPAAFLTSNFNSTVNTLDTDKIAIILNDCKDNDIKVTEPDINRSFFQFKIEDDKHIRYGLGAIKGVGEKAAQSISQEREKNGPYVDFYDFLERVGKGHVNKRVLEALVKAGAFDSIGEGKTPNESRPQFFEAIAEGLDYVTKFRKKQMENVKVLGNALDDAEPVVVKRATKKPKVVVELVKPVLPEVKVWDEITLSQNEKACLGIYYSTNPYLNYYTKELEGFKVATPLAGLNSVYDEGDNEAYVGGLVEEIKWWKSKKGAFVRLSDGTSTVEVRMYEDFLNTNKDWLKPGAFVSAKVKMERKEGEDQEDVLGLSCQAGFSFEETKKLLAYKIYVGSPNNNEFKHKFSEICEKYISSVNHLNDTNVVLCVEDANGKKKIKDKSINLSCDVKLFSELKASFGDEWVKCSYKQDIDNVIFPEVRSKKKNNYNNYNNANKFKKAAFVS